LLAGRRSAGKTYFSLGWASSIARGEAFGFMPCLKGKVVYFSQEMTEGAIRRRLLKLFTTPELAELADRLIIVCREPVNLTTDEGADALAAAIKELGADVVFIDALRDIKGGFKENSNDDMGVLMVRLRDRVASAANCAIILVHHKGKPQKDAPDAGGRGASVIEDVAADIIYLSDTKNGSGLRDGRFEKTREGEMEGDEFHFEIADEEETKTVKILFSQGEPEHDSEFARAEQLANVLAEEGSMTREEVMRRMSWTHETARLTIRAGKKARMIDQLSGAHKGQKATYGASKKWSK
jgi:hypothetical protein